MNPRIVKIIERISIVLICMIVPAMILIWHVNRPHLQDPGQCARQESFARESGLPLEITNSLGMRMRLIPPGEYRRGSPPDEPGRRVGERQHRVVIPHAFYVSVTPVTQYQYEKLTGTNPSYRQDRPDFPADSMTWYEALEFCNRLSRLEGLPEVYGRADHEWIFHMDRDGYRLTTEAEWEYACRAGTETAFYTGPNDPPRVGHDNLWRAAWYQENSDGQPQPVGRKEPNRWGLHDMLGNVWEWCWDWYAAYPVAGNPDLRGPERGVQGRVIRGGSWYAPMHMCRAASRRFYIPDTGWNRLGFRVVRTVLPGSEMPDTDRDTSS